MVIPHPFPHSQVRLPVYHSASARFDAFDFEFVGSRCHATLMQALYFSGEPQGTFGPLLYTCFLDLRSPVVYDLAHSRFDAIGVQEALDALMRGDTSYVVEDLVEFAGLSLRQAEDTAEKWRKEADGAVVSGVNYAFHSTEYLVFAEPPEGGDFRPASERIWISSVQDRSLERADSRSGPAVLV